MPRQRHDALVPGVAIPRIIAEGDKVMTGYSSDRIGAMLADLSEPAD